MRPLAECRSTLWNEPNFALKWLSRRGRYGSEKRRCGRLAGGGLGGFLRRRGLEVLEGFEGTEEHAVSSINAPLNAGKRLESGVESVGEWGIVLDGRVDEFGAGEGLVEDVDAVIPELGFDAAQAPLDPFGGNKGIDERELDGVGRLIVEQELFGEGFEFVGIFAGDDVGPRVDAGFEGIECGSGFALWGYWAGRFLGIESIGVNLCFCGHRLKTSRR